MSALWLLRVDVEVDLATRDVGGKPFYKERASQAAEVDGVDVGLVEEAVDARALDVDGLGYEGGSLGA